MPVPGTRTFTIGGGRVLTDAGFTHGSITVEGTTIRALGPNEPGADLDATGLLVSPGFVDLQINGGFGMDLAAEPESMWDLGRALPCTGVTSFLPTLVSSPPATIGRAQRALADRPESHLGAEPLGLHLEGPMLAPRRRGAHDEQHLAAAEPPTITGWSREAGVALVTLAPELPGAVDVIEQLTERGVIVAAGHSDATASEAETAMRAGLKATTHVFNAMAPMGHRVPSLVGLTLAEPGLVASLIVDGVHVDPVVVAATWNAKGPDGLALITDAVSAMGMPAGEYELGSQHVTSNASTVRNSEGTLAGSTLTMDRAVRNLVSYTGCSPEHALEAATGTPARLIGETRRGLLAEGAVADLVLLTEDLEVEITICGGQVTHATPAGAARLAPGM